MKRQAKEKTHKRKITFPLIGALLMGILIFFLLILNLVKNTLTSSEADVMSDLYHFRDDIYESTDTIDVIFDTLLNTEASTDLHLNNCIVYDTISGKYLSNIDNQSALKQVSGHSNKSFADYKYQYCFIDLSKNIRICIETDILEQLLVAAFFVAIILLFFLVSLIFIAIFLCVANRLIKKDTVWIWTYRVSTTIWLSLMLLLSTVALFVTYFVNLGDRQAEYNSRLEEIINEYNTSEEEREFWDNCTRDSYLEIFGDDDQRAFILSKNTTDTFKCRLYSLAYYNITNDSYFSDVTIADNFLDSTVPIEERVIFHENNASVFNRLFEIIAQTIMLLSLHLVTLHFAKMMKSYKEVVIRNEVPWKQERRIIFFTIAKSLTDALMLVVSIPLFKTAAKTFFGDGSGNVLSITITAIGVAVIVGTVVTPYLRKWLKNTMRFYRFSLLLCIVGAVLSYLFFKNYWGYLAGYLLIAMGNAFSQNMFIMHSMELKDMSLDFKSISFIANSRKYGQIIGFVVSGIICAFLNSEVVFAITGVVLVVIFFASFSLNKMVLDGFELPAVSNWTQVIKRRDIYLFALLMLIPFGFISYFFKYQIPVIISGAGYTTCIVSFIFFLRYLMIFLFKTVDQLKAVWKKISLRQLLFGCMLIMGVVFITLNLTKNIVVVIVATLLFSFIMSRFSALMNIHMCTVMDSDLQYLFGVNTVRVLGTTFGSSIAPYLGSWLGAISLPIIMIVASTTHFILTRPKTIQKPQ